MEYLHVPVHGTLNYNFCFFGTFVITPLTSSAQLQPILELPKVLHDSFKSSLPHGTSLA